MSGIVYDEKKESALRLQKIGKLSNEEIAEGLGIDIDVVNALEKEQKAIAYQRNGFVKVYVYGRYQLKSVYLSYCLQ